MESKMPNPTRIEINCETGVESIIELTDAEVAELTYQAELAAEKKAEEDAAKAALEEKKQEVLEKLGLSAEEVAALLA
jgi:tRNA threonylcarbamoyladenosine modification (KEOPS) complex  Pcc1 subunit